MISELQQEQAALHALGLLDADEADAFERQLGADAELRGFVRELRDTAAQLALVGDGTVVAAPAALRERVLAGAIAGRAVSRSSGEPRVLTSRLKLLPWALAALFMGCTGVLIWGAQKQQTRITYYLSQLEQAKPTSADYLLTQISFCALDPTPDFTTAQPRAAVVWDAVHHQGKLRVNRLAPPVDGKDYQLWTVEAGRKEAVNAGVVHVDADGKADISFRPADEDGKPVVAVAISLERAGGSPTNQGPILLLGKF